MGFMNSYKRLDNLCRDMNGIGVTGYIEDMEQSPSGAYYVPGWKDDYFQLKHYRHIRNQIAHENYADEENMCSEKDEAWVESFYRRIMTQNDPLALYHKTTAPNTTAKPKQTYTQYTSSYTRPNISYNKSPRKHVGCVTFLVAAFLIATVICLIIFSI